MKLDLKKLNHLVTVARLGSLSKAAEQLHLSQPALSRSVALIEEQVGAALFERSAQGVVLTSLGEVTAEAAEKLLLQATIFERNVTLFSRGESGRIAFGIWPVISSLLLPDISAHFMSEHPKINMRATIKPASELMPALYAGEIEWLLGGIGYFESAAELNVIEVGAIDVGMVVRAGHPLAKKRKVKRQDLFSHPVLCGVELSRLPSEITENGVFIADNFEVLKHTTLHSDGYWITPLALVNEDIKSRRLKVLTFESAPRPWQIPIALVSLKGHLLSPLAQSVADYACTVLLNKSSGSNG
ncbi:LysR family transcriptional regulator [Halioxenophilus sp. WMMB6]|uniref:LysR family transcriptional regulator n=1 Tax=Halioxenophilus sp. WMMB6 TaxID=3073815 RepID=UPI00295F10A0|nr:LysR family transcriptional regulator [Halioxenophilus sp. WMMB6]